MVVENKQGVNEMGKSGGSHCSNEILSLCAFVSLLVGGVFCIRRQRARLVLLCEVRAEGGAVTLKHISSA